MIGSKCLILRFRNTPYLRKVYAFILAYDVTAVDPYSKEIFSKVSSYFVEVMYDFAQNDIPIDDFPHDLMLVDAFCLFSEDETIGLILIYNFQQICAIRL